MSISCNAAAIIYGLLDFRFATKGIHTQDLFSKIYVTFKSSKFRCYAPSSGFTKQDFYQHHFDNLIKYIYQVLIYFTFLNNCCY